VTHIALDTMMLGAKVAAPVLLTALLVGFLISLFQAATQIQEPTLSFVPKMIAVCIALLVTGNWVLSELVSFTHGLFDQLPALLGRT
jgi:flagellar biosynthetic protein FliQ